MERIKLMAVVIAMVTAFGMAGCQRDTGGGGQGGQGMDQSQGGAPSGTTGESPSGGTPGSAPSGGGAAGDSGAGSPPPGQ